MAHKKILLIEPGYKNKYPPLGLMKIAQYHGPQGKQDYVKFIKGEDSAALGQAWDRIYITTLFSFEWAMIARTIDFAIAVSNHQPEKIFVGGIAASLMHDAFLDEERWYGIRFIKGLLGTSPAPSLQLDDFSGDFYADDISGTPIEDLPPDYSILEQVEYRYPVSDAYFVYASRGCIRTCKFCGVPTLEGTQRDTYSVARMVNEIERIHGPKKDLIYMDNNVVASARFHDIVAEARDLGFVAGAKLQRPGERVPVQRRVDFNQGVDARILCKDHRFLEELATICISPLRIAFDHLGLRKSYELSVRYAHQAGLNRLSNYMLYNFHDTPTDLYARMDINVNLNEELGCRIFSFPMRYQPTDRKDRGFVGEHWNRYYLRSMQLILQATHGVVSGAPEFFRRAFGKSTQEFENLLSRPHRFIFHRDWFEQLDGRAELAEFEKAYAALSSTDRIELLNSLSGCSPRDFNKLPTGVKNLNLRRVLKYYPPLSRDEDREIWEEVRRRKRISAEERIDMPEEERIEDAGLEVA